MNNSIIRSLALCFIFCLTAVSAMAVPAKRIQQRIRLTDGSEITATLCGDERVSYYETSNGALYFKQADGICRPTSRLELQMRLNERLQAEKVRQQLHLATNPQATPRLRAPRRQVKAVSPYTGSKKGLVILVNFKDKSFNEANPQPFYHRMFNQEGFSEDGQTGSVHDYFLNQSYGTFDLTFDVVGPVTLSQNMSYYGAHTGEEADNYSNVTKMVDDACRMVDDQVNFKDYDWNNDGYVDQVYIIYAGYGEATGGGDNTIWPHAWGVANGSTLDDTRIYTYACSNELNGAPDWGTIERMGIGTACHEFSHCLGLPDFYNTDNGSGGGGASWDVMSGGNYNNNGRCPVGYTSYERWMCGWLTPIELDEPTSITNMPALENEGVAYILTHDTNEDEYFLLENRQRIKWDRHTGGKGLLIFHVDYEQNAWAYNTINNDPTHERMALMAADGDPTTKPESDPFPGPSGTKRKFTDSTTPGAKLYNPMPDGTTLLGKPIENITETAQGTISFDALTGVLPSTQISQVSKTKNGFTATWDAIEGAESYNINLRAVRNPYTTPQEGEVLLERFSGCYGSAISNIANKLDSYTDNEGWSGTYLYRSSQGVQLGRSSYKGSLLSPTLPETVNGIISTLVLINPKDATTAAQGQMIVHTKVGDLTANFEYTEASWLYLVTNEGQMPEGEYTIEIKGNTIFSIGKFIVLDGKYEGQIFNDYFAQLTPASIPSNIQCVPLQSTTEEATATATKPQRAKGTNTLYTSTEPTYTFTGLDNKYTYYMSVSAVGANGKGRWSDEYEVKLPTAIQGIKAEANEDKAWYTLQGHHLITQPTRSGIYIHNGKKVTVK